jgi:AcrR family transcriptional regulator
MSAKKTKEIDTSTEEKIKAAARKVFTKKGYAASRTRDIAEESGINLALLNYYFRSKEKLFEIIMLENIQHFMKDVKEILTNEKTSLTQKIELLVENYIDMLIRQPDLPLFILSELRSGPQVLANKMGIKEFLFKSHFMKQLIEVMKKNKIKIHPLQFIINTIGMTVFPFVGRPVLQHIGDLKQTEFIALMEERKKLIPGWIAMQLGIKTSL